MTECWLQLWSTYDECHLLDDEDAEVDELSLKHWYEMTQQGYEVRVTVTERYDDRHVIPAANQCSPLNYSLLIS